MLGQRLRERPRFFAIAHVALLVLQRALREADDVGTWDLIAFLNAQSESLGALLRRPEVHFRNPFSFPLYNVGAESAVSAALFKALGPLSLYWSPVLVLLAYDALYLFLVDRLFCRVLEDERSRTWAWLLLSMSAVTLTLASTQAFTMQAYWPIALALLGVECFVHGRDWRGASCLAAAFLFLSQGYALSFLIPYYTAAWALFRALACGRPRALRSLAVVAVLALAVNAASGGAYLRKISPLDPYESGNVLAEGSALLARAALFLRQSFWPEIRVDGVPVGFAPYFLHGAALVLAAVGLRRRTGERLGRRALLAVALAAGLVGCAYTPSFLSPVVKSQRSVPGDLFLALVVALGAAALVRRGRLTPRLVTAVLLGSALLSDAHYLYFTLRVDHTRNHSSVFDFDLSDGIVRHDLQAAILKMKEQVDVQDAVLVIVSPRGTNENTTDPALFHARFLRHFGSFAGRPEVVFPCGFCDPRYGCPFPALLGAGCAERCCYEDPSFTMREARRVGRPVLLWWWKDAPEDVPSLSVEGLVAGLPGATLARVPLPPPMRAWECYEVILPSPGAPSGSGRRSSSPPPPPPS